MKKYRDWPKRIHIPDTSYFVTFYTKHRYPYFKEPVLCDVFLKNLKICKKLKSFLLFGWVIIYEHIHLLLHPTGEWNISEIMHCLKRHTSRDANIIMGYTSSPVSRDSHPDVGDMDGCVTDFSGQLLHKHQGGDSYPHLQSGVGMNRLSVRQKILSSPPVSRDSHPDVRDMDEGVTGFGKQLPHKHQYRDSDPHLQKVDFVIPQFQWQQSFYDRYVRNDTEFNNVLDYIAYNPEKHHLPADWPYVFTNPKFENLTDDIL